MPSNNLNKKKVIAAIIRDGSKVLLAQRAKKDALCGKWEFPGGKVEEGESDAECLKRELFEEFGIDATIGSYFCSSFFEHKGAPFEMRVYCVDSFSGIIELREHQCIHWVLPQNLSQYDVPDPDKPVVSKLISENNG